MRENQLICSSRPAKPIPSTGPRHHQGRWLGLLLVLCGVTSGCAALTNPVADGIPVRRLPSELFAHPRREAMQTIPLTLLQREAPEQYLLAPEDVLGIFVDGILPLTSPQQPPTNPPVYFPSQIDPLGVGLSPALGFPLPVRSDGKVALPLIAPVPVAGLTVEAAADAIRDAYLDAELLQRGRERILVTLMQPRRVRVKVFRQELGGFSTGGRGDITSSQKLGTGHIIDLRATENDVLTALALTGGLPGLDAFDDIVIFRGGQGNLALAAGLEALRETDCPDCLNDLHPQVTHIPTRWPPGQPLPFGPGDIILRDGDIVFLEARSAELFYTGGLLPASEHVLPRDYDLDVVEAVAQVRGTLINGAFGGNNLSGELVNPGLGNPSPSQLTVVRQLPDGGQVPIRVDLNRALTDPRERILVQPGDVLILQETAGEAIARYLSRAFHLDLVGRPIERRSLDAFTTFRGPSTESLYR